MALLVCPPTWPWSGHYDHGYIRAPPPPNKKKYILRKIRSSGGCFRGAELANLGNSGDEGLDRTSQGEGDS